MLFMFTLRKWSASVDEYQLVYTHFYWVQFSDISLLSYQTPFYHCCSAVIHIKSMGTKPFPIIMHVLTCFRTPNITFRHLWSGLALKGQKWITQRDVRFTAVYIYGNAYSTGYWVFVTHPTERASLWWVWTQGCSPHLSGICQKYLRPRRHSPL